MPIASIAAAVAYKLSSGHLYLRCLLGKAGLSVVAAV